MSASPVLPEQLHLWWLADPRQPRPVGTLQLLRSSRGVSLRYDADWRSRGIPLSEDLPLLDREFLPVERDTAAGAVDDARPDRWGERVIRVIDKPPRLSVLDYLFHAGDDRFGALGVSTSATHYRPRPGGPLPRLADVPAVERLVARVLAGEEVDERERRLVEPGASFGGARPKALIDIDGEPWLLKFGEPGETTDAGLVEHATLTLAASAGIRVVETRPVPLARGHAIAVRRFDRAGGRRVHALSANVVFRAVGTVPGYPELAQWLRRRGVAEGGIATAQRAELFRRLVFNILVDNTDDHEKNHVLLLADTGDYALAPAFDVLPSGQALGHQQMRVGADAHDATLANALSECPQFGLRRAEAEQAVREVAAVVDGWQAHFARAGVAPADIASLARQIDRPFLKDQRDAWRR